MKATSKIIITVVAVLLLIGIVYFIISATAKSEAASKVSNNSTAPLIPGMVSDNVPVINADPHNTQTQQTSLFGNISKWWNLKFHNENNYVQVPPIDDDGIDANGKDFNGFLVRV